MLQNKPRQSDRDSLLARLKRSQLKQPVEAHPHVAKRRLPSAFQELSGLKDGKQLFDRLTNLIKGFREGASSWNRFSKEDVSVVTPHFVYGLCQLVHDMRDRKNLSPSRRKSFALALAKLLQIKDQMGKRAGSELVELIFRTLCPEEYQREIQGRQWENERMGETEGRRPR